MKLLLILFILVSCQSGSDSPGTCDNSKSIFSDWSLPDGSGSLTLEGATYDDRYIIGTVDDGVCYGPRGDFELEIYQNGTATLYNCSGLIADYIEYSTSCNILNVTYASGSPKEQYH